MKASRLNILALTAGFAVLAAFPGGSATADDNTAVPSVTPSVQSGKTRAEVRAEYLQARREGKLPNISEMDETSYTAVFRSPARPMTREPTHAKNVQPRQSSDADMGAK